MNYKYKTKKQRGLRRYYRSLLTKNEIDKTYSSFVDPKTWPEYQHIHFDRRGYGNNSFKRRRPHLDLLFRHFEILIDKTEDLKSDFQLYAILLDFDSASDALFLHEAEPNNRQFPFKVSDLSLKTTLTNKALDEYINSLNGYEKLYGWADEAFCLIFKKDAGIAF